MRLFVFESEGFLNVGVEVDGHKININKLSEAMEHIGERTAPYVESVQSAIEQFEDVKKMIAWGKKAFKDQFFELFKVNVKKFYPPIDKSAQVVCLGKNYVEHAKETGGEVPDEPILFGKFATLAITDGDIIMYPKWATRIDPEPELGVIIGKECKDVDEINAMDCVFGYTIVNDITERNIEFKDMAKGLPWFRSKNFETSLSIGPYIVTKDEVKMPPNLEIELYVNGVLKQKGNTRDMIFKIDKTISYISKYFTLYPGDVISTGTVPGILPIEKGDEVLIKIEKVGELKNRVSR
jgi:2-keto-4-pentenoate hydratase/2-oxohepta-3-ene-1,7-dioic acid hydratase (catechol pathway)